MKHSRLFILSIVVLVILSSVTVTLAQDKVNLVLWHAWQDAEGDALLAMIDAFQTANPDITVEQVYNNSGTIQDSFIAAAGAGEGPDMVIWANDKTGPWAKAGLLLDLTMYIDEDLKAQVSDAGWGTYTFEDSIWGVPESASTLAFFYNKSLVPDAPETWADVLSISEELAVDGFTGLAWQNCSLFHSAGFLYSFGGALMDADGNAAFPPDSEGRTAMEEYLGLHKMMYDLGQDPASGVVIDCSSPVPGFQTGEVAMVYDGLWNLATFEGDLGEDLGVALMPKLDNGNVPALFAQTKGFFVNANVAEDQAKIDAIMEWAKFITGPDGQQIAVEKAGHLPVNPSVELDNPHLQTFAEQFALGTPFPNRQELDAFWGPMGDAIIAVGSGGETPAEAAANAYDLIQASIDEMHAQ